MATVQIGIAAFLGVACLWISFVNWSLLITLLVRGRAPALIPLVGGLLGVAAILLGPAPALRPYWWLPFLVDAGSLPGLVAAALWSLRRHDGELPEARLRRSRRA
jgi:hypothetical protein